MGVFSPFLEKNPFLSMCERSKLPCGAVQTIYLIRKLRTKIHDEKQGKKKRFGKPPPLINTGEKGTTEAEQFREKETPSPENVSFKNFQN